MQCMYIAYGYRYTVTDSDSVGVQYSVSVENFLNCTQPEIYWPS